MIKKIVKNVIGFFRCRIKHIIFHGGGVYIGRCVHVTKGHFVHLGKNVSIRPYVDIFPLEKIEIADGCDIGTRNRLSGNIIIDKNVLLGPDNYISSVDHCFNDISKAIKDQGTYSVKKNGHNEILIGEGSWIGTHVAIIGDVHIGKHCVIGANSVVTKDIPNYCVVAGNPGKIIKKYNFKTSKFEKIDL